MPPLSLTQSKYAFAVFGMSVKSVPGCFVAIPPSLIGVPVAFWPLPRPHFDAADGGLARRSGCPCCAELAELDARRALVAAAAGGEHRRARPPSGRPPGPCGSRGTRDRCASLLLLRMGSLAPPGARDELRRGRVGHRQAERRPGGRVRSSSRPGSQASSSGGLNGTGANGAPTRSTGASRSSNAARLHLRGDLRAEAAVARRPRARRRAGSSAGRTRRSPRCRAARASAGR